MATIVSATWIAIEGHEGTVAESLQSLVEATHAEPGNLVYEVYVDDAEPRVFRIFEKYVDDDAFQAHIDSPHFSEYGTLGAIPHLEGRERRTFRAL
ncbi:MULTISPECIES: putative quinol monooxygenase [unclassified Curtobacterium]|uniref:putative quinol monooxygenase n=1 Tax=unclassified Curtobacterium TaxID=257496 RepID=UPI000DA80F61|nr:MULTISPECIES: putative quinol monooxygenase [unclassified Curtobacterium]PZE27872.1 antibiotic biosynthesis monooxygenase [Curtobacterium sp. MCBD17_028]PZE78360.1 antibiotic biosynthesis monooxygenase [Curtobacterium sp. MCBD17_019]PZF58068.1 antibiotic biosynthesis monooxygenase [Curtobacterium sp. MCBD17_013]PZF62522.1 antibiotic biosynthesis monooxygenase [Curtobacterium sp. MCBD17_034]PZM39770.1 antibiotic biosynthesis monooxygenase [Curtobacterium sp. MCBD17_031]